MARSYTHFSHDRRPRSWRWLYEVKGRTYHLVAALVAGGIAWRLGYSWKELQEGVIEKISSSLPALMILWAVGLLIGSWVFSGTIPMIIYYGVDLINPEYLVFTAFIIAAIISTTTGTSWGSAGTVGVAIMGIAQGLDVI